LKVRMQLLLIIFLKKHNSVYSNIYKPEAYVPNKYKAVFWKV
jgi:hypothetical protein